MTTDPSPATPSPLVTAPSSSPTSSPRRRTVLLDVRWSLGAGTAANRAAYLEGHLPGAAFLDLEQALSDPVSPDGRGGRHPLPSRTRVQEALRTAGVREDAPVVVYDARTSLGAARAWWVLRHYGISDVRVLDGGLEAWRAAGLAVEEGPVDTGVGDVVLGPGEDDLLDAEGVRRWLAADRQLLDARPADRYRGENEVIDPVAGHIPGALSLPALSLLAEDGTFLPAPALRTLLEQAGADPDAATAVYCGSGVQAAHAALALEAAGLGAGRSAVYVGSWSDWISDPGRPTA
ncbi:sulfurtransferase [Ornithinimicrobium sp. CNJ-824]|uniref:sulfurtransferase n=1 Tax=Ornithinimicrobium sp. CNJ-824 TaxID=1904966 RepID=UPI000966F334|nr:rhodanese-like domain-containing protein [Ornithinimicrobium sp. CNJ-824]OLT20918.1 sulfurtransferase [Ornithinimicrobium sp. CNJ-824]